MRNYYFLQTAIFLLAFRKKNANLRIVVQFMKITRRHFTRLTRRAAAVSADLLRSYDGQASPPSPPSLPQEYQACFALFHAPRRRQKAVGAFFVVTRPNYPKKKLPCASRGAKAKRYYSSNAFSVFSIADKFKKSSTVTPSFFAASSNLADCSLVKEQVYMWSRFSGSSKSSAIAFHLAGGIGLVESQPFKAFSETESLSANSFRLIS